MLRTPAPLIGALGGMKDLLPVFFEFLKLGFVGLVAGIFSSALSVRDHRRRIWWEMKVAAYKATIEALSDLVHYYEQHYNATIEYVKLEQTTVERLDKNWDAAYPVVRKHADSGAFLFSERANAVLREFTKLEDYQDSIEYLEGSLHKARVCLDALVECSKSDLQLPKRWYER